MPLGTDVEVGVGDWVIAVGNAPALPGGPALLSIGVVSTLGRSVETTPGLALYDLIQTDIVMGPGHSGAALVNLAGELVGITTEVLENPLGCAVDETGIAIDMETVVSVASQLVEVGRVRRPFLGVNLSSSEVGSISCMPGATLEIWPSGDLSARVEDLVPSGPAGQAGIEPGDVIVSLGGHEVDAGSDVLRLLRREFQAGQEIEVVVSRDDALKTLQLVLGERPE